MSSDDTDWAVMEPSKVTMDMVVTDVAILAKREKVPTDYVLLDNTNDGKRADFPEGRLGMTRRYLCFTRKTPSPTWGRVALEELKVMSATDRPPLGYRSLAHTRDDNTKVFSTKQILAKYVPLEEVKKAVTDIVILSASKKEDVPPGYTRLPDINGFSICYKVSELPKSLNTAQATAKSSPALLQADQSALQRGPSVMVKQVRPAIDGLQFKLNSEHDVQQFIVKFALSEFALLTIDDIEQKFDYDWSRLRAIANPT